MSDILFPWILVTGFAVYAFLKLFDLSPPSIFRGSIIHGPIISSANLLEGKALHSLHKGTFSGCPYNLLTNGMGRVMVFVELGRNTHQHIVAIGDKSNLNSVMTQRNLRKQLISLELEGDFPTYFKMYCTRDKEQELLQLFDPSDMAYFADFCRAYNFEIYKDTVYFSQGHDDRDFNDTSTMTTDIEKFLERNKRLLDRLT